MITSDTLRKLAALDLNQKQMAGVLDLLADVQQREEETQALIEEKKKRDRERKRNVRGNSEENPEEFQTKEKEKRTKKEKETPISKENPPTGVKRKVFPPDKPPDVSKTVWEDFLKQRKAKKAPVTETALNEICMEASKAGWPLEDALREMCARGWQGFKADWVAKGENRSENTEYSHRESKSQRARRAAFAGLSPEAREGHSG